MKQSEIKNECELIHTSITNLQERRLQLQSICKHPNTFKAMFAWRVGANEPALLCSDCDAVVSTERPQIGAFTTTST